MKKRYSRNFTMISETEFREVQQKKVCVIGCGGLGGHIIEMLGRFGVGRITCVDGDSFDETNLNRQILSDEESIGVNKAQRAKDRMIVVNPDVNIESFPEMLCEENIDRILQEADIVVDALDSISIRMLLQSKCEELKIPMVHGAIAGWFGHVTTIMPGDKTLDFIYKRINGERGVEKNLGNPSFTPCNIASIQVSEVIKVLIGRGDVLSRKIMFIDMLNNEHEILEL